MKNIEIFDSEGKQKYPEVSTRKRDRIVNRLGKDLIRFAVRNGRNTIECYLTFNANEVKGGREERFYIKVTDKRENIANIDEFLGDFLSDSKQLLDEEMYKISRNELLSASRPRKPRMDDDIKSVLKYQASNDSSISVKSSDLVEATWLACYMNQKYGYSAAVLEKEGYERHGTPTQSDWDMLIVAGGTKSISLLNGDIERIKQNMRQEKISERIDAIEQSVEDLVYEYNLSENQVRNRVHDRVPALKQPKQEYTYNRSSQKSSLFDNTFITVAFLILSAIGFLVVLLGLSAGVLTVIDFLLSDMNIVDRLIDVLPIA